MMISSETIIPLGDNLYVTLDQTKQNIQIRKGWKALLWNQVKSKMESSYSELVLVDDNDIDNLVVNICSVVGSIC